MAGSSKRPWGCMEGDGEGGEPPRELKRWRPLILEVMGVAFLQNHLKMLEPNLRRVVREELEKILANPERQNPRPPVNQNSNARYHLRFQNELPDTIYTGDRVKSRDDKNVEIVIFDTLLQSRVISDHWSSVKVEVVVLHGHFPTNDRENWSKEEFRNHIANKREGRRPLLLGDFVIKLNQGVGYLTDIKFTDNSSWTSSGKFRLALRLHKVEDVQVKEGISGLFKVNEGRLKAYKKHHPPLPTDEVYYLEGIHKDGEIHKRLLNSGISMVQQLLRAHFRDPEELCSLIRNVNANKKGVAPPTWESTIKNAEECHPGDELYSYYVIEVGTTLIFNSFYQLLGVYFGEQFCRTDNLNAAQKASVGNLTKLALLNPDNWTLFDPMLVGNNPTSSFVRQQECSTGGRNGIQSFPDQAQCCGNEVLCDEVWTQDPFAQSFNPFSQRFTPCQEASTSMFRCDPSAADQMNHLREEDYTEMILEYRRPELVRHWAKAITKLKFVIHFEKSSAARRSKNV